MCEYSVKRIENKIFFAGKITPISMNELKVALEEATEVAQEARHGVFLHIDSEGGDPDSALGMADYIADVIVHVHCIICGQCASAATFIAMSCYKTDITKHSLFMIHEATFSYRDKVTDMERRAEFASKCREKQIDFYLLHLRKNVLFRDDIDEMLRNDTWMDANEAFRNGFVSGVIL